LIEDYNLKVVIERERRLSTGGYLQQIIADRNDSSSSELGRIAIRNQSFTIEA
jgi:hypothetical protein